MKMVLDMHTHTIISGHAYSTIDENVRYASSKGIELLGITEHSSGMPGAPNPIYFHNFKVVPRNLHGVEIMLGVELNIMDYTGKIDMDERTLKMMDIVIASIHPPCIKPSTIDDNTQALIGAIKNPFVDIIGHPGDPRYPIDVKEVYEQARLNNTLLEINNVSLSPVSFRSGSEKYLSEFLKFCKKDGMPIIISSDAHFYKSVGDFSYAEKFIIENNFPQELVLNTSVDKFKMFFRKK